jgi:predicted RNase H-like nuclease (RuvC/YqgF family)
MASPTENHNQTRARVDEYARKIEALRAENDALLASIKETHRRIEATELKKQRILEEMHALMAIIAAGEAVERRSNR